jgi:hypothetical protein
MVNRHATGNEVPPPEYSGYAGLQVRRLAGVVAGRLEPTPALLPGLIGSGRTLGCRTRVGLVGIRREADFAVRSLGSGSV